MFATAFYILGVCGAIVLILIVAHAVLNLLEGLWGLIGVLGLILLAGAALADWVHASERTFYDASGKVIGRAVTDSHQTTFYDALGKVTARAITSSRGETTVYDALGKVIERSVKP